MDSLDRSRDESPENALLSDEIDEEDLFGGEDYTLPDARQARLISKLGASSNVKKIETTVIAQKSTTHKNSTKIEHSSDAEFEYPDFVPNKLAGNGVDSDSPLPSEMDYSDEFEDGIDVDHECNGCPQIPPTRNNYFVDLPRFVRIQPALFDPHTYEDAQSHGGEGKNTEDALGTKPDVDLCLDVENTVRWKLNYDEKLKMLVPVSNASLVVWSDGRKSLLVGDEVFDALPARIPVGQSLFAVDPEYNVLTLGAPLEQKLMLQPSQVSSSRTHRLMSRLLGSKVASRRRTKMIAIDKNPEYLRVQMIEAEKQSNIRQQAKSNAKLKNNVSDDDDDDQSDFSNDDNESSISINSKNLSQKKTSLKRVQDSMDQFFVDEDDDVEMDETKDILDELDDSDEDTNERN